MSRLFTIENIRKNLIKDFLVESVEDLSKKYPLIPYDELINWLKIDPTYKNDLESGLYSDWLLTTFVYPKYKNRKAQEQWEQVKDKINPKTNQPYNPPTLLPEVKTEDIQKLHNDLQLYNKYKSKINRPITDFKTEQDLYKTVQEASKQDKQTSMDNVYTIFKNAIKDGLKVVYGSLDDNSKWVIGIPETFEASHWFKKPVTNWCTAYPDNYKNYMDEGDLYIHLNKQNGKLYQLHIESDSFMDKNDEAINVKAFIQKYPELKAFYNTLNIDIINYPKFWSLVDINKLNIDDINKRLEYYPGQILYLDNPPESSQMIVVMRDPETIRYIDNPNENVCKAAIAYDGERLPYKYPMQYIKNPSKELEDFAIKFNPANLAFINEPTKEQRLLSASLFKGELVKEITQSMVVELVKDGNLEAITLLDNPSEKLQEYVLLQNLGDIQFIRNPSINVINKVSEKVDLYGHINENTAFIKYILYELPKDKLNDLNDNLKYLVLSRNENDLKYINDFSDNLLLKLVYKQYHIIKIIDEKGIKPGNKVIEAYIQYHPDKFKYFYENGYEITQEMINAVFQGWANHETDKELFKYMLDNNIKMEKNTFEHILLLQPYLVGVIKDFKDYMFDAIVKMYQLSNLIEEGVDVSKFPDNVLMRLIRENPDSFKLIPEPSIELQKMVIKEYPELYHWIKKPTEEIKKYAKKNLDKQRKQ